MFPVKVEQAAGAVVRELMQTDSKKLVRFFQSWVINTVAVLVAGVDPQ